MKETVLDCDFYILNRLPELYSAKRFQAEIDRLNLNAKLISPEVLIDQATQIEARGLRPAILYRQGDYNFWPIQTALSKLSFPIINSPASFLKARDKWETARLFTANQIPSPRTLVLSSLDLIGNHNSNRQQTNLYAGLFDEIQGRFKLPFILKKRFSSQGRGVFLIANVEEFSKVLLDDETPQPVALQWWIAQECITESLGQDTRVFSINERHYAIDRKNQSSFRSNLHQGGSALPTSLRRDEIALVQKIHALSGLHYSGIDFLRTKTGPQFLEINPSPGFEGIEKIYPDSNIAGALIQLLKR